MSESSLVPGTMPPNSTQAEEGVLGSILINPKAFFEVASFLKPEHFFILRNEWIFDVMCKLAERNEPIEFLTIVAAMEGMMGIGNEGNRLDEIGGSAYITHIASMCATSIHAEAYGRIVQRAAIRRHMIESASEIIQIAREEDYDIYEMEQRARAEFEAVFAESAISRELSPQEIADEADNRIFESDSADTGISFMITEIDKICGHMIPGDAILIVARTGIGKTRYVTQLALKEAQAGHRVLFMTTEEKEYQTHYRLIEMLTNGILKVREMRAGYPIQNHHEKSVLYLEHSQLVQELPIDIVRCNGWDVNRIVARIARAGVDAYRLVVVDYLGRLGMTTGWKKKRSDEELGHRMQVLKNAALDYNTVLVVPNQVNRAGAKKDSISTSDVAESDKVTHEADMMLGIARSAKSGPTATFSIGKTRHADGLHRTVKVAFDGQSGMYSDAVPMPADNRQLTIEQADLF